MRDQRHYVWILILLLKFKLGCLFSNREEELFKLLSFMISWQKIFFICLDQFLYFLKNLLPFSQQFLFKFKPLFCNQPWLFKYFHHLFINYLRNLRKKLWLLSCSVENHLWTHYFINYSGAFPNFSTAAFVLDYNFYINIP